MTISGGLFCGLSRETAARFSFLLSLPAVFAAGVLELYHERDHLLASQSDTLAVLLATVVWPGRLRVDRLLAWLPQAALDLAVHHLSPALGRGIIDDVVSRSFAAVSERGDNR